MRFYHLADLHIGKKVNGFSMLEDQAFALEGVLANIDRDRPDAVLLAGDLYDRRNPGPEAMALFDDFLTKVVLERKTPVLAVGGNHDSGERLDFAQGMLAQAGYYMAGSLEFPVKQVRLEDAWGPVNVTLFPFADKARLRFLLDSDERDYSRLMAEALERVPLEPGVRQVLVHHGLVFGPNLERSESERDLFIGGTDVWTSQRLADFDYVALGHLHKAQLAGSPQIAYAGSLCKYSFSEEAHIKQVLCVDMDQEGALDIRSVPIPQKRNMVSLRGKLADLEAAGPAYEAHRQDYVRAILSDQGPVLEPMVRLRAVYPYIMLLEREQLQLTHEIDAPHRLAQGQAPMDHFRDFFEHMTGHPPDKSTEELMESIFERGKEAQP